MAGKSAVHICVPFLLLLPFAMHTAMPCIVLARDVMTLVITGTSMHELMTMSTLVFPLEHSMQTFIFYRF